MARCRAVKEDGNQCKNAAVSGSKYCAKHKESGGKSVLPRAIGGALIGGFFAGPLGAVVGGVIGAAVNSIIKGESND